MKKLLSAAFVVAALALQPSQSQAFWNTPQKDHGLGWLKGKALNTTPWMHFHGPLFNYGPYTTPGHVPNFVPNPIHGGYYPAYPPAYYGYENPAYAPNTIQPYFPSAPMQNYTAPLNIYTPAAVSAAPSSPVPVATTPTTAPSEEVQPAAASRTPGILGSFRRR